MTETRIRVEINSQGVELDRCLLPLVMAMRTKESEQNPNSVEVNLTDTNLVMI